MSSVHYKFKATLEYKTLTFDGLHIGVDELKKAICDKENIRTESFDLLLTNAHTKREYTAGELVPRNSSVVVQRVPRDNAQKLPKVQDTSTSGIIGGRNVPFHQQLQNTYINPEEFAGMTEEQRLAHIKRVSTEKYSSANYQRRTGIMTGPPPATYVCNRCGQPGHWYKSCPLLNVRRTAGITMDELMETDRDDPLAMIHPSGKFVKPIMHHQARMQRKHEPFPGQPDESAGRSPGQLTVTSAVPEQFKCRLCGGLLRDAVLAACCGHSFCAECYQQQLLAHPTERCPGPDCGQQISADSLVPNKMLREAVQKYTSLEDRSISGTDSSFGSIGLTPEQSPIVGANKPSVLTDTHSLLHKLLPGLANAQAQRELATTVTAATAVDDANKIRSDTPPMKPSTDTTQINETSFSHQLGGAVHIPTEQQQHPTNSYTPPVTSVIATNANTLHSASIPPTSKPPAPLLPSSGIHLPLFDPNKPPPPIGSLLGSALQGHPIYPPASQPQQTTASSIIPQPIFPAGINSLAPPSALTAEDSLSAWESFLKRKEDEKAERTMLIRSSYQQQRTTSFFDTFGSTGRERDYGGRDRDSSHHREHSQHRGGADRDRDKHHHHHHHHHSRSSRKEDEPTSKQQPSKLSVEELNSAWKYFEKHSEKKQQKTKKDETEYQTEEKTKEEEMKRNSAEREHNHKEEDKEGGMKKKEDEEKEMKMKKEEDEDQMGKMKKKEEGTTKNDVEKEREEKEKVKQRKEVEKKEEYSSSKRAAEKITKRRKSEEERHQQKTKKDEDARMDEKPKGRKMSTEQEHNGMRANKDEDKAEKTTRNEGQEGRMKKDEGQDEMKKEDEDKGKMKKEKKGEDKEGKMKKEKKGEDKEGKVKKEKGEGQEEKTKKRDEDQKEKKTKKDEEQEGKKDREKEEKKTKGKDDRDQEEKTKKKDGEKEERKKEENEKKKRKKMEDKEERHHKNKKELSLSSRGAGENDEKRRKIEEDKRKISISSPPMAVNQLDLALAQQQAGGWRAGRLRHAPPQFPPNFEDTNRWRPIPEVQVRTESPTTTGDELFINMAEKKRRRTTLDSEEEGQKAEKDPVNNSLAMKLSSMPEERPIGPTIESSMPPSNKDEKEGTDGDEREQRRKRKKEEKEKSKKEKKKKKKEKKEKKKKPHKEEKGKEEEKEDTEKEKRHKRHHQS